MTGYELWVEMCNTTWDTYKTFLSMSHVCRTVKNWPTLFSQVEFLGFKIEQKTDIYLFIYLPTSPLVHSTILGCVHVKPNKMLQYSKKNYKTEQQQAKRDQVQY